MQVDGVSTCERGRMLALAPEEYEPYQSPPPGTNVITPQLLTSWVIRDGAGMLLLAYIRGLLVPMLTASCSPLSDVFLMLLLGDAGNRSLPPLYRVLGSCSKVS